MTIAAKISPTELTAQVASRFTNAYLEARLINAPGTFYVPGTTNDASFLGNEVPAGTGGYTRRVMKYANSDISAYGDDGIGLATKTAIFTHDGGATSYSFSHVTLCWSTGNILTLGAVTAKPTSATNGTYTGIPITPSAGSGKTATADLVVTNVGASTTDFVLTIRDAGYNFAAAQTLKLLNTHLVAAGVCGSGAGDLTFSVGTVNTPSNAGSLLSVAQLAASAVLTGGNQAVFYFNLKQFGFNG